MGDIARCSATHSTAKNYPPPSVPKCPKISNVLSLRNLPSETHFSKLVVCLPILSGDSLPDALPPGAWVLTRPSSDTKVSISRLQIAKVNAMHFRFLPCLTHRKEQILLNTNYITSNRHISVSEHYYFFSFYFSQSLIEVRESPVWISS